MFFFSRQHIQPIHRNFSPSYMLDDDIQVQLMEQGYAILRNIIREDEIQEALAVFEQIKENEGYDVQEKFESSGNFKSVTLQQYVFSFIKKFMLNTAHRYANLEHCEVGDGGAFFIKPNTGKSRLDPHQDSPVIDETSTYAVFTWIPLQDINEQNGALYVLPKSHLWGNCYRSQHIPWAFGSICKELWKQMIPLYINKGDLIVFDPSIIHASEVNNSGQYRIVICGALLPLNHQKVEYTYENKQYKRYFVDDNYWLDGGLISSLKNYTFEPVTQQFPNPVKYRMIKHLISK